MIEGGEYEEEERGGRGELRNTYKVVKLREHEEEE